MTTRTYLARAKTCFSKLRNYCYLVPALLLAVTPQISQATDISQLPIESLGTVKPNIIMGYDDSGSMDWDYLPDGADTLSTAEKASYNYNPLAFNPKINYKPWVKTIKTDASPAVLFPDAPKPTSTVYYYELVPYNGSYNSTYLKPRPCDAGWICTDFPKSLTGYALMKTAITTGETVKLQNYANWKQYGSTRQDMVSTAMSNILPNLRGMNIGVVKFSQASAATSANSWKMYNMDYAADVNALLNMLYTTTPSGTTPTHATLKSIAALYNLANVSLTLNDDNGINISGRKGIIQFACQKNAAFIITDGYTMDSPSAVKPPYSQSTYGAAAPYQPIYPGSLADIALGCYTTRLRTDFPADKVATDQGNSGVGADTNNDLHINTYALTLGVKGNQYGTSAYPIETATIKAFSNPPGWQDTRNAIGTPTMIDDLWHATINGRGLMFSASNPENLVTYVKNAFLDIILRAGSQSSIAVANVNMSRTNDAVFGSSFNSQGWYGDVAKYPLNITSGSVDTSVKIWSAMEQLDIVPYTSRNIFTKNNLAFSSVAIQPPAGSAAEATAASLNAYLRGDRSLEGTVYRSRQHVMGDVVNADPVIYRDMIYQAANDGMLHAFDINNGKEKWAYVPSHNYSKLGNLSLPFYSHQYLVDGTPVAGEAGNNSYLVGGLGAAGFGYYAIDITAPTSPIAAWEFPKTATESQNGGSVSINKPRIIPTNDPSHPYVVLINSSYNNGSGGSGGDGKGHVWIIDPVNGNVIRELVTPDGTASNPLGLSTFAPLMDSRTGKVSYLYGGDELGNIWKIDASSNTIAAWTIRKFAAIERPITLEPEIVLTSAGEPILLFGTGRLLGMSDLTDKSFQGFYAIKDSIGSNTANPIIPANLQKLAVNVSSDSTRTITQTAGGACKSWNDADNHGWYFDFSEGGERAISTPTVGNGSVYFTSNVLSANQCSSSSYGYKLGLNVSSSSDCSLPTKTGSNYGKFLGGGSASRPVLISLPNGGIKVLTHLGDGSVLTTDTGTFSLVRNAIRSWRPFIKPMR